MRWFVRGDVDGFFGLAVDNLVQLLLIVTLCRHVLGFDDALLYARVLPGIAISLAVGNFAYARQAIRTARREGRADVCALPYGINTISLFAYVFLVMLPARQAAEAAGIRDPALVAWRAGLWACLGSGLIEFVGAFFADRLRRVAPRAALLSTLSGIALSFISLGFLFRTFAHPVVGMSTLGVVFLVYFGKLRFPGNIPGGLVAVLLGTVLCWVTGLAPVGAQPSTALRLALPMPVLDQLWNGIAEGNAYSYVAVILPMGLFNLVGSLQNLESAEAAGDSFAAKSSLATNGIGSLLAAIFGSCFPTTIYIGHPGWKAMGARAGYSLLNGVFFTIVLLSGGFAYVAWAVPVDAGMAIVLWIGIVITAQAFQATPRSHAAAVVVGLLPGVAAWGALMAKAGLRAAGMGTADHPFGPELIDAFARSDTWIHGAFALEHGFIFTAMILSATVVGLIRQRYLEAAAWCGSGSLLSLAGLMHSYRFTQSDTAVDLSPAWPWSTGYLALAALFALAHFLKPATASESEGLGQDVDRQ